MSNERSMLENAEAMDQLLRMVLKIALRARIEAETIRQYLALSKVIVDVNRYDSIKKEQAMAIVDALADETWLGKQIEEALSELDF